MKTDIKTKTKLLKALNEILPEAKQKKTEEEILNNLTYVNITDPAQIVMFCAKTPEARLILREFIEEKQNIPIEPVLEYETDLKQGGKYSLEYLESIFKVLSINSESVKIFSTKDYPITLETDDFKVILAPRVEQ